MYTPLKNYQLIISLLKQHGISHLVLSPGARNIPFVQSVENDPYFHCYSVADERSAAYMALGLSLRLNEPVVISCTSSTATCNYYPAIAEAYHQGVPLIALTSDRNPALAGQREDQMIDQPGMYGTFVKKAVNLPVVRTEEDFWHCGRLVNEAILAAMHHGKGPVQINIPMLQYAAVCSEKECVPARMIRHVGVESPAKVWAGLSQKLNSARRIMVICGQSNYTSPRLNALLSQFTRLYRNVLLAEYMANVECEEAINPFLPFETHVLSPEVFEEFLPELVISMGGNVMSGIKSHLRGKAGRFEHWGIEESGEIVDLYKSLTTVFECSPEYFLEDFIATFDTGKQRDDSYASAVRTYAGSIRFPELPFSNNTVIRDLAARIPDRSVLHLSINNSIRLVNFFGLPGRSVKVYANIGTYGIDGCLSSFIGQAVAAGQEVLSFLIIGDLSFFYDMGAMRIRHIPKTTRILLVNNYGGGEFHYSCTIQKDPTMDLHTTAAHQNSAKGWVESLGFTYLQAKDDAQYQAALDSFLDPASETPVVLEVFSDMETDAAGTHRLESYNRNETAKEQMLRTVKEKVVGVIGTPAAKRIIDKLK